MIQRKQSLFLILGAAALFAIGFLRQELMIESMPWLGNAIAIGAGLVAITAIYTIVLYSVREKQLSWTKIVVWMSLLVAAGVTACVFLQGMQPSIMEDAPLLTTIGLAWVGVILFVLAQRGIRGDIERVRSMDRLR